MSAIMLVSSLVIIPFGLISGETYQVLAGPWPSAKVILSMIILVVVATVIGTIMIFVIISRQGASFLSQINFMVPVFGILWSMMFLSEILPANALYALALILAGVAIARINPKSKIVQTKEINS